MIDILSKNYEEDLQKMSLGDIENFLTSHEDDYDDIKQKTGVTLINCLDFKDVKERHIPTLKVKTFVKIIKNEDIDSNLKDISAEQLQALNRAYN